MNPFGELVFSSGWDPSGAAFRRRPSARSTLPKTVFKTIRAFSKGYLKKPPGPYKINMQSP